MRARTTSPAEARQTPKASIRASLCAVELSNDPEAAPTLRSGQACRTRVSGVAVGAAGKGVAVGVCVGPAVGVAVGVRSGVGVGVDVAGVVGPAVGV